MKFYHFFGFKVIMLLSCQTLCQVQAFNLYKLPYLEKIKYPTKHVKLIAVQAGSS